MDSEIETKLVWTKMLMSAQWIEFIFVKLRCFFLKFRTDCGVNNWIRSVWLKQTCKENHCQVNKSIDLFWFCKWHHCTDYPSLWLFAFRWYYGFVFGLCKSIWMWRLNRSQQKCLICVLCYRTPSLIRHALLFLLGQRPSQLELHHT